MKKTELYAKLSSKEFDKLTREEIDYLKNKISNDKLGLKLDFTEMDKEDLENYFVLREEESLGINVKKDQPNNLLIEGDNYHALKALKAAGVRVDIIYIDPPYNTGKEFVYKDDFGTPQTVGSDDPHKHSKWLSFMKKRLDLAKELLSDEGVIFVSIDDNEQAYLKVLMDEIFGEENFVASLAIENNPKGRKNSQFISVSSEYCVIFAKSKEKTYFVETIPKNEKDLKEDEFGNFVHNSGKRVVVGENSFNKAVIDLDSQKHYSVYFKDFNTKLVIEKENNLNDVNNNLITSGYKRYISFYGGQFVENTYTSDKIVELFNKKELDFKDNKIYEKNTSTTIRAKSIWRNLAYKAVIDGKKVDFEFDLKTTSANQMLESILGKDKFENPKNVDFIKNLIKLHFKNKDALILDFFAGSGTTGQAVMELNFEDDGKRRFILITNNEKSGIDTKMNPELGIARSVTRERLFRVINESGSKGEKVDWSSNGALKFNSVAYFTIEKLHKVNGEYEQIDSKASSYKREFNKEISVEDFE